MSIDGWMDKQNAVYMYNGILFSLKKEENSDTCYSMVEPIRHYAKWSKAAIILYDSTYMRYLD